MPSTHNLACRIGRALDAVVMVAAAIGLLAMMVHITADVLGGLLFGAPLALTSTYVTQYYMIAVAFLPIVAAEFRTAHIDVDLFVKRLSPSARRLLTILVLAVCLGIYLMLASQAWQQALSKFGSGAYVVEHTSRVVVWPSFFMLPVAFALSALLLAGKLVLALMGEPVPDVEPADQDPQARAASV